MHFRGRDSYKLQFNSGERGKEREETERKRRGVKSGGSFCSSRNFIERRNPGVAGGGESAGSFNNVISSEDLEFLRQIGNKLMQLSLIEGGRDWTKGVEDSNFEPCSSAAAAPRSLVTRQERLSLSCTHCRLPPRWRTAERHLGFGAVECLLTSYRFGSPN